MRAHRLTSLQAPTRWRPWPQKCDMHADSCDDHRAILPAANHHRKSEGEATRIRQCAVSSPGHTGPGCAGGSGPPVRKVSQRICGYSKTTCARCTGRDSHQSHTCRKGCDERTSTSRQIGPTAKSRWAWVGKTDQGGTSPKAFERKGETKEIGWLCQGGTSGTRSTQGATAATTQKGMST